MAQTLFRTSPTRKQGRPLLARRAGVAIVSCLLLPGFLLECAVLAENADQGTTPAKANRRPIALVLAEDGRWLFVATQRGTICTIDTSNLRLVGEAPVGRKLADVTVTPDGNRLLAVDEDAGELLILSRRGLSVQSSGQVKVSPAPVSVQVAPDGSRCTVASLWSRRLTVVALDKEPRVIRTVDLPFAPRKQLLVREGAKAVVADAFGGGLAVVDVEQGAVDSVRSLPVHNMRGLALSADGKSLLVTHQTLNPLGGATRDDIHWGNLLTNNLRSLPLADVLDPKADPLRGSDLLYFGEAGHGTGDPAGIAVAPSGTMLVALAGVHELAVGDAKAWRYVHVGARPITVAVSPDGQRAYVANIFADSVSVVDTKNTRALAEVSLGTRPEPSATERGERLFHDARLSHDGWMSCHSCHTDGHSNGRLADTLGDGTYGTPKRVLSLLGVGDTGPWAWNGSMTDLESQVRKSIETTMHGKKPSAEQVGDLTAYLKTLPPPPSRARLLGRLDEPAVKRGNEVFTKQSCASCHTPPTYTSRKTYDVGLADEAGLKAFNPPSLRGIGQGGPYFHDGRAPTLPLVFTKHRHQLKAELSNQDVNDLLEFLGSL
jgi:YVTN family beta-propeller protein